jgi:hypothetical protein
MLTAQPTLLIGPADWQADRMPRAEFARRSDALWRRCPAATRVIVYGDRRHHAELAYLTNLTPKLDAAVAVLSRSAPPRLFVGGGPNMIGAAKPLTFVADLQPLNRLGDALRADGAAGTVVIGGGSMPVALRKTVAEAIGPHEDATSEVWRIMARKAPCELAAVREACALLTATMAVIGEAVRSGAFVTAAVLAGERAAHARGAQDVRTLFSLDSGRTLQPFEGLVERAADPLQVYAAVRSCNYWAEGFASFASGSHAVADAASTRLKAALATIKSGTTASEIAALLAVPHYRVHPVTDSAPVTALGVALEEPPYTDLGESIQSGDVYSLRSGLTDGAVEHAIVSAMIAVREDGIEVMWASPVLN